MKKSYKTYSIIYTLTYSFLLLCNHPAFCKAPDGFTQICNIYTATLANPKYKTKTTIEKLEIIDDHISKEVTDPTALKVFSAVAEVNPTEKYKIFKQSAESVLKHQWDCPAMVGLNKK